MDSQLSINSNECLGRFAGKFIIFLFLVMSSPVHADDPYLLKQLFNPGRSVQQAEAKGRVMIYDGMKSDTVDAAMNLQFKRVENMMFVRTQYEQENGEYETENDGCD